MTRPKREFEVGDRVRVYPHGGRSPFKAKIYGIVPRPDAGTTDVFLIEDGFYSAHAECPFHAKQLRRLVPRKRREWEGYWDKAAVIVPDQIVFIPLGTKPNTPARGTCATLIEAPSGRRR